MKNYRQQKGFTLVELLVAMSIFLVFVGVLIGSYTSIVRGQREANEYRIMYVEARKVFETIGAELRNGMVDYGLKKAMPENSICLISKDAKEATEISYVVEKDKDAEDIGSVKMKKGRILDDGNPSGRSDCAPSAAKELILNSEVNVKNFKIYATPTFDPYDQANVKEGSYNPFQPKVTVFATFEKTMQSTGKTFSMDLQTTISSRIYNQVYKIVKQ